MKYSSVELCYIDTSRITLFAYINQIGRVAKGINQHIVMDIIRITQ